MDELVTAHAGSLPGLSTSGWFSEQPAEFQARMAKLGRWIGMKRGNVICSAGDEADAVFGLGDGLLDIAIPVSASREVVVHRAAPGFWTGEAALLPAARSPVSIHAASHGRLFRLSAAALQRSLRHHPQDWLCFYRLAHGHVNAGLTRLAEVIALPSRVRFARTLLRLSEASSAVRMTQEELGRMVGLSRSAFRRCFADLIDQGIVELQYGSIRVRDRRALQREAARVED